DHQPYGRLACGQLAADTARFGRCSLLHRRFCARDRFSRLRHSLDARFESQTGQAVALRIAYLSACAASRDGFRSSAFMDKLNVMEWSPVVDWLRSRFGVILAVFVLLYIIAVIVFIVVY